MSRNVADPPARPTEHDWLGRYRAGQHVPVWDEMRAASGLRTGALADEARAVAVETMRRVRRNVERAHERLLAAGYEFQAPPLRVHAPPGRDTPADLDTFEASHGPLPLSLRAFYETVGTVDFCQSLNQLVHWHALDRTQHVGGLRTLGEYDPLVVLALPLTPDEWDRRDDGAWFLAPDELHKANYSGGENYHVLLPDPAADFRIDGMYGVGEWFVDYLRATMQGGGFRGRCEATDERVWRVRPTLPVCRKLARDLVPF